MTNALRQLSLILQIIKYIDIGSKMSAVLFEVSRHLCDVNISFKSNNFGGMIIYTNYHAARVNSGDQC